MKQSIKSFNNKSDGNTLEKLKKSNKTDLKTYLTFSVLHQPEANLINHNVKTNYLTANNEKCNSYRINSESSITNNINTNIANGSNRRSILEAMKVLKFQKSSLDHQKYSLERLTKSRSNLFCLMISFDQTTKNYVIYKIIVRNLKDYMK